MKKQKVLLTEEDFRKLTNGEIIEQGDVEIALQDIGFLNMIDIIYKNVHYTKKPKK